MDPFDEALIAVLLGAAEALKVEADALAEIEARFGRMARRRELKTRALLIMQLRHRASVEQAHGPVLLAATGLDHERTCHYRIDRLQPGASGGAAVRRHAHAQHDDGG